MGNLILQIILKVQARRAGRNWATKWDRYTHTYYTHTHARTHAHTHTHTHTHSHTQVVSVQQLVDKHLELEDAITLEDFGRAARVRDEMGEDGCCVFPIVK
jgi:protein-arginine kinase activator protein McsA